MSRAKDPDNYVMAKIEEFLDHSFLCHNTFHIPHYATLFQHWMGFSRDKFKFRHERHVFVSSCLIPGHEWMSGKHCSFPNTHTHTPPPPHPRAVSELTVTSAPTNYTTPARHPPIKKHKHLIASHHPRTSVSPLTLLFSQLGHISS